jgi:hypothetical protein
MKNLFNYFGSLRTGKIVLWCYLIWYMVMVAIYFDSRPSLWINSIGISVIIGAALILSVIPVGGIRTMEKWTVARLFMMPFCVSSYAALIKDQGFIVIFSPKFAENATAAITCAIFVAIAYTCKAMLKTR